MPDISRMPNLEARAFAGNRFAEALLTYPCPQRILMVTDGSLDFGTGFFGLSEFVSIVAAAGHTIATAHRGGSGPTTIAGAFTFDASVNTAQYDQLWLFGFSSAALQAAEQSQIAQFMKDGGGVFATGDHGTLGRGMGGFIPRVRAMRNWAGIPMSSPQRLDTVIDPGSDNVKQFNDQANAIAQRIYPVFFSNGGPDSAASSWNVHPVLRHPSGAVDWMPDHAHESECLAPAPGPGSFAGVEEWPEPVGGGPRIAAQVVSVSISGGRFIESGAPTPTGTKPPVAPRSFGGISAYDGDAARVGRIVCDATWHHFVNINLNGSGAGSDSAGQPFEGLYSGGSPTPEYQKIQRYYLNTVRWLAPRNRRRCWPFIKLALARFDPEMLEFELPHPHPCPWDPLVELGLVAEHALTRQWGPGTVPELVAELADTAELPASWQALLTPLQAGRKETTAPSMLPLADLRYAMLGAVVNQIAETLPADAEKLAGMMKDHERLAAETVRTGLHGALPTIAARMQHELKQLDGLQRAIAEFKV